MIIACDVDGVLANLHEEWLRRYNRDYGDSLTSEQITRWEIDELVKPEARRTIFDYLRQPDLYDTIEVIPGALEGVRELKSMGHRVVYATSNVKGMTDPKWAWLERNGFLNGKKRYHPDMVIAYDKTLIAADLLIDDRADNISNWYEKRSKRSILFDAPYNRNFDRPSAFWLWAYRAMDWGQVLKYIEGL